MGTSFRSRMISCMLQLLIERVMKLLFMQRRGGPSFRSLRKLNCLLSILLSILIRLLIRVRMQLSFMLIILGEIVNLVIYIYQMLQGLLSHYRYKTMLESQVGFVILTGSGDLKEYILQMPLISKQTNSSKRKFRKSTAQCLSLLSIHQSQYMDSQMLQTLQETRPFLAVKSE